jgi:hypothetical protein
MDVLKVWLLSTQLIFFATLEKRKFSAKILKSSAIS